MTLISRPEHLDPSPKINLTRSGNSRYEPVEMTDVSVYDLAKIGMTMREIASMFRVPKETVMAKHGEAFNLGKGALKSKPRLILSRLIDKLEENMDAGPIDDAKTTGHLLAAIAQMDKYIAKDPVTGKDVDDEAPKLSDTELAERIAVLMKNRDRE